MGRHTILERIQQKLKLLIRLLRCKAQQFKHLILNVAAVNTDTAAGAEGSMQAEAVQALVALGYGSAESLRAVKKTSPDCQTVEDILKEALKYLF